MHWGAFLPTSSSIGHLSGMFPDKEAKDIPTATPFSGEDERSEMTSKQILWHGQDG